MDIDDENIVNRQSYTLDQPIFDNLNILYNSQNSTIVLWNKYQIFIYESFGLQSTVKALVPEFQIYRLIVSNNYLLCLDNCGNIHFTSMKFKNTAHNNIKIPFQPRDQGIKTFLCYNQDYVLSLKYEAETYFLYVHRINSSFEMEKLVILLSHNEEWPVRQNIKEKYIIVNHTVDEYNIKPLKTLFKVVGNNEIIYDILVLSFDNFSLYGCLFSLNMEEDETNLIKLYTCPAEICSLQIVNYGELHLIIALTMGTVIRLSLNNTSKAPDIIHFNTSLYKTLALNDSIIYTDGMTMWKAEHPFTANINFTQFFLKDTNDFVKYGDQIICTTFSKLIYIFSVDDQSSYIIRETAEEYCSAEQLFNNSLYMDKLWQEVATNDELVKKMSLELYYIPALALSNMQHVVKKAIESSVLIFENYEDVDKTDLTLTEELKEYFEPQTWIILVKLTNSGIFDILDGILSHLSENIRIYITLFSKDKIMKTTTIKLEEPLKNINFLIPLHVIFDTEIIVNIKLVIKIPGAVDDKPTWTVLYKEEFFLNCEHFIRMNNKKTMVYLKNHTESIEQLIHGTNMVQYGCVFEFNDVSQQKETEREWSFYIKLPNNYFKLFETDNYLKKHFNPIKSTLLLEKLSAKEFLNANNSIIMTIGNEKLKIKIQNDGFSNTLLMVTGGNLRMAFNLRSFFSNMLYNGYEDEHVGREVINTTFYTATENLQKAVKDYIINKSASFEEFLPIMHKFERDIIGNLPL